MKVAMKPDLDYRVLGSRLQEARKARGLTQQEVAETIGVSRPTYVAIEKGERRLAPDELIRLASLFGRALHEILRQREPVRDFIAQFRAATVRTGVRPEDLAASVVELQRLCDDYAELESLCGAPLLRSLPPPYEMEGRDLEEVGEEIALQERARLGIGEGPFPHLRALLEADVGLRIFCLTLPAGVAGLFIYTQASGGCIAIQRDHPRQSQLWSLAHEYAHFLVHRYEAEVTLLPAHRQSSRRERFADAFAASFLLPAVGLRRRFRQTQRASESITPATLLTLADLYGISGEMMSQRLENLRLIREGTWDNLRKSDFRVRAAGENEAQDRQTENSGLPPRYQRLAAQAYEEGGISEEQFAHFLRTDRVSARRCAASLAAQTAISEEGEPGDLRLDLAAPLSASGD